MKKFIDKIIAKIKQLDKGTICRTILQFGAYANQLIALIGRTSYADSTPYQIISFVVTTIVTAVGYWYNNNWSGLAILAGRFFKMLRDGTITPDEANQFMDDYAQRAAERKNAEK